MNDAETIKKQLEREKKRQIKINAYHRVFKSDDGQIVLADIRESFGTEGAMFLLFDNGESKPSYDPINAALRDGQRQVVLHIEKVLREPVLADGNIEKPKKKVKK